MSNNIKNMPTFRGRFGTRSKRKKTNPKWDKWRYPRGIDISWRKGDNKMPKAGYGCDKKYKDLHPSGRTEVYVANLMQLEQHVKANKDTKKFIYRLASKVGAKKRIAIKEFAEKNKLRMINLNEKKLDKKVESKKTEAKSTLKVAKDSAKK